MTVLTSLGAGLAVMVFLQSTPWIDPAPHRVQFVQITDGVQLEVLDFSLSEPDSGSDGSDDGGDDL